MKSIFKNSNQISKDITVKTPKNNKSKSKLVRLTSLGRSKSQ
jgi:hypothetical protein